MPGSRWALRQRGQQETLFPPSMKINFGVEWDIKNNIFIRNSF